MRTQANRPWYDRSKLRYPSDLTGEKWAIIAPLIPAAKKGGNKRTVDVVGVVKCRRRRSSRALTPQRRRRRAPLAEHQQPQGDRAPLRSDDRRTNDAGFQS